MDQEQTGASDTGVKRWHKFVAVGIVLTIHALLIAIMMLLGGIPLPYAILAAAGLLTSPFSFAAITKFLAT